jgi:hypothetical protein
VAKEKEGTFKMSSNQTTIGMRSRGGTKNISQERLQALELGAGVRFPRNRGEANALMQRPEYLDITGVGNPIREMVTSYFQLAHAEDNTPVGVQKSSSNNIAK